MTQLSRRDSDESSFVRAYVPASVWIGLILTGLTPALIVASAVLSFALRQNERMAAAETTLAIVVKTLDRLEQQTSRWAEIVQRLDAQASQRADSRPGG